MSPAKAVGFEALLVTALGLAFALVANALSPRGLALGRDYFREAERSLSAGLGAGGVPDARPATTVEGVAETVLQRLRQRGLQVVASAEAVELFRSAEYAQGLVVFVDARDDALYTAGHIPGAWQFHHYRAEKYLPGLLPACLTALQVVVYCSGGDCEDSELAAVMLRDAGVGRENLYVYPGGMAEWSARKQPVETGARQSGAITSPQR